ncbi:5-methyltetrahydropteroyltriglutamate--homocysteine S-methyltransferase [Rhizobium sp. SL86]|uniref:5-methyltetrahydropteroyltriglutamate-- homocysteine S-methyltransferase n=1 Tax=Rhizobium sp. SL86 TaxID=2995148 RepID=UPI0022751959|nr:5-methyltetrahydropteroyltriglutamate--homocysteine S-methyltransferase [Rhizobium sp. SL86]MCY1667426.1 5-methyltetrahydropteroyltriglutamate--homocysteine S-methyltransferase [Rhizobium sp. SL86]
MSIKTANLGFPRIGRKRELKFALEAYWAGKSDEATLLQVARDLRHRHWKLQQEHGIDIIPSNDFSLYDHVLDHAVMVGAIPDGYGWTEGQVSLETYFALARGKRAGDAADCGCANPHGTGRPALEMTKWFDTNYHYLVPEFQAGQAFSLTGNRPLDAFLEAREIGIHTRPVILGPVTFLKLGKARDGSDPLDLLDRLLPVYRQMLAELHEAGADWVQIDEPCLALDLTDKARDCLTRAFSALAQAVPDLSVMVASYFGAYGDNLEAALALPVDGAHIDGIRGADELNRIVANAPPHLTLSLGVLDGRNIWRADLDAVLRDLAPLVGQRAADRLQLAPSCSLLHLPYDLADETALDLELRASLSFATEKLEELAVLKQALSGNRETVETRIGASVRAVAMRRASRKVHDPLVEGRLASLTPEMAKRTSPFAARKAVQAHHLSLPPLPTTTIGSFPQTSEVRAARAAHQRGELSYIDYRALLERETEAAIRWQEDIGIDVLVHGEFERNDMVQYFAEQMDGYAFTRSGWVQSYGSRCVRPPIIFGDVSRPRPMTVDWAEFAQSKTAKPVKGMLTGPVTMLQWSFVRDDIPRAEVCRQIALAIRDEVTDLEAAGIAIIQIDEPALREGLPLRRDDWQYYLEWATESFRLSASSVADQTQIHTHMCYSEFNDIMPAIVALDADVISIETSRSKMELLDVFGDTSYPNEIGPGVYDIHSPRVPTVEEMVELLEAAARRIDAEQLWVNPDCGLKTRGWAEVKPALANMVSAARLLRKRMSETDGWRISA